MICKLPRQDPSLSSMNEKSFETLRVRTHPCTDICATGAVRLSASLTEIGVAMAELNAILRALQRPHFAKCADRFHSTQDRHVRVDGLDRSRRDVRLDRRPRNKNACDSRT